MFFETDSKRVGLVFLKGIKLRFKSYKEKMFKRAFFIKKLVFYTKRVKYCTHFKGKRCIIKDNRIAVLFLRAEL